MVGEAKRGARKSPVCTEDISVHTVQSIISPCGNGDMLVKTGQSVRQFHVIKISRNHVKRLRVLNLQRADGFM